MEQAMAQSAPDKNSCAKCGKTLTPQDKQANAESGDGMNLCADCRAGLSVRAPAAGSD